MDRRFEGLREGAASHSLGFTLAEVLITLGIIGIVAAMTIPTLIAKYQEKEIVSKLKKSYSTIQQAFQLAKLDNGEISQWSNKTDPIEVSKDWINVLRPYLKIVKVCTSPEENTCFTSDHASISGSNDRWNVVGLWGSTVSIVSFVLSDGSAMRLAMYSPKCTYGGENGTLCGNLYVDLNGNAKPNVLGKDSFGFSVLRDKIVPFGILEGRTIEEANADCIGNTYGEG